MERDKFKKLIFNDLKIELEINTSLSIFARERSKFEGWLKVKIIEILSKQIEENTIYPEKNFGRLFSGKNFNELFDIETFKQLYPNTDYYKKTKKTKNFDIYIEPDWIIELKTVTTNFKKSLPKNANLYSQRPIKGNVEEVMADINVLKKIIEIKNRVILFIVFPLLPDEDKWKQYYDVITKEQHLESVQFNFKNGISGILYFGFV